MKVRLYRYQDGWNEPFDRTLDSRETLLLIFGAMGSDTRLSEGLKEACAAYPKATVAGCSGAGEIFDDELLEHSLVLAVVKMEKSRIKKVERFIDSPDASETVGRELARELLEEGLRGVFVISEGLIINGTELTRGLNDVLPSGIVVTGGLAGDDDRFETTYILQNGCEPKSGVVSAIGFYGEHIRIAYGYRGGWDKFGIEREITASRKNVLYTLNNEPALEVYKRYLGKYAEDLPGSGLLFPLAIREPGDGGETKVRTILSVDEKEQSITFAGDMPEGNYATFMKANFDRLIDGAYQAAESTVGDKEISGEALSIAVSCVGRKLLLKERTEEELEAVLDVLPEGTRQVGFYSYGEISTMHSGKCDLHNQTMTLTLLWET